MLIPSKFYGAAGFRGTPLRRAEKMKKYGNFNVSRKGMLAARKGPEEIARYMEMLSLAMVTAGGESDPAKSARVFLREICGAFRADAALVFEFSGRGTAECTLEWAAEGKVPEINVLANIPDAALEGLYAAFRRGRGFMISDMESFRKDHPDAWERLRLSGSERLVVCPLTIEGHLLGFAAIDNPAPDLMNVCMSVFQIAASYISTLLRHRDYVKRIEERGSRDPLTGLLSVGSFRRMLEPLIRGVRDGTDSKRWTVIYFNITGFRTYNLARGHAVGDELLMSAAGIIREELDTDFIARFGSDHFYAAVSGISADEAVRRICGRIRAECRDPAEIRTGCRVIDGTEESAMKACDLAAAAAGTPVRSGSDAVTGLPDSSAFSEALTEFLGMLKNGTVSGAWDMVSVNIRKFKVYNSENGFAAGNRLLRNLADAIRECFRTDLVTRMSSDQFYAVIEDGRAEQALCAAAEALRGKGGDDVSFYAGIYRISGSETENGIILDRASLAAAEAQGDYLNWYCRFESGMESSLRLAGYVTEHLDEAIESGWIRVYYQPVIGTFSGKVAGYEALTRWNDPVWGFLGPDRFIPVLEKAKILCRLDLFVIEEVAAAFEEKLSAGIMPCPVSVNLSRNDLDYEDLHQRISGILANHGVPHEMLRIEITESAISSNEGAIREHIERFHLDGHEVWLDDFGSGYSSLNTLQNFRFDLAKLDMMFLRRQNERTPVILRSMVDMCKHLGIRTLAEGVETGEKFAFLRSIGCELAQGFYFSKPDTPENLRNSRMLRSIGHETPGESQFYRRVAGINVLNPENPLSFETENSSIPAAVLASSPESARIVWANGKFLEFLGTVGKKPVRSLPDAGDIRKGPLGGIVLRLMEQCGRTSREAHCDFVEGGMAGRLLMGFITGCLGQRAFYIRILELEPCSGSAAGRLGSAPDIYGMFESVFRLDLKNDRWSSIYGILENTGELEDMTAEEASRVFAVRMLPEGERKRYLAFTDAATAGERTDASPSGMLTAFFHVIDSSGSCRLRRMTFARTRTAGSDQFILAISKDTAGWSDSLLSLASSYKRTLPGAETGWDQDEFITADSLWQAVSSQKRIGFFWKDRSRRFLGASASFCRYYGLTESDLLGKTDEDMGWHPHPEQFRKDEERVLKDGDTVTGALGECLVGGEIRKIIASKVPVRSHGKIIGLAGCFIDITDAAAMAESYEKHAELDRISGLLSESAMLAAIGSAMKSGKGKGVKSGLIEFRFSMLDVFRDAYGQELLSDLIRKIASVLSGYAPLGSRLCRRSGGRFDILVDCGTDDELYRLRKALSRSLDSVRSVDGTPVTLMYRSEAMLCEGFSSAEDLLASLSCLVGETRAEESARAALRKDREKETGGARTAARIRIPRPGADEARQMLKMLGSVFDTARLIDVSSQKVIRIRKDGTFAKERGMCFHCWDRPSRCENCICARSLVTKSRAAKIEFAGNRMFLAVSRHLEIDGQPYELECACAFSAGAMSRDFPWEGVRQKIADSRSTVWTDELTGARNRRYFSEQLAFLQADGVAAVDIDGLKKVNEKFGLRAGDAALRACVRAISASFGCGALVCRYGADIFAVVCHDISQAGFRKCCEDTAEAVRNAEIPGYPEARITVSIGGHYGRRAVGGGFIMAERLLRTSREKGDTFTSD